MAAKIELIISGDNTGAVNALRGLANVVVNVNNTINNVNNGINNFNSQINNFANGGRNASESFGNSLLNVSVIATGVYMAINKIKDAVQAIVMPGIEFDKQMEITNLGIAGVLMSMTKLNNEALKLPDALAISGQAIKELTQASGPIGLPLKDLTDTYQAILGAGLTQKMTMKEIVDFTITGTKAVKTMMSGTANEGMQVVQELRSMISGNIDQNSQVARSLGITNTDVEKAKQSAGGLFAYLQDKLSGFAEIVKIYPDTLKGKIDKLTSTFQQMSGAGFEPFIQVFKDGLDSITPKLLITDTVVTQTGQTLKTVKLNPELMASLTEVSIYVSGLINDFIRWASVIGNVAKGPAMLLLNVLKFILDHAGQITSTLMAWFAIQKIIAIFEAIVLVINSIKAAIIAAQIAAMQMGVAITGAQAAAMLLSTTLKAILVTTGWGILAAAIGYAAQKMYDLYTNTEKVKRAKLGLDMGDNHTLGSLSSKYESNGEAGIIADTDGDAGGKSYGAWQLSMNMGSLQGFVEWLNKNGWEAGKYLTTGEDTNASVPAHNVQLGSQEFDSLWKGAADKFGDSFLGAQKQYIKEAFYDVGVESAKEAHVDIESRSEALKQVIWSASVQHGPGNMGQLMQQAAAQYGQPNGSYLSDEQLIKGIYAVRSSDEWTSGSPSLRPQLRERFNAESQDALARLANEKPVTTGGNANGDLTLKNQKDDAEAIAKAKIALAEATEKQEIEEYINQLKSKQSTLDQRRQATNQNMVSDDLPAISEDDYYRQTGLNKAATTEAEIKMLESQLANLQKLSTNNNLSGSQDSINIQAQIVQKGTDIAQKRAELAQSLQQLGFEENQAQKELSDKVTEMQAQLLEAQGKTADAARLRDEKEKQNLLVKLTANGKTDAVDSVNKLYNIKQSRADFNQSQQNIEVANGEMITTQVTLMNDLAKGTKSAAQVTQEYTDDYNAKVKSEVTKLEQQLADAVKNDRIQLANSIRAELKKIPEAINEFAEKVIQQINTQLQNDINSINADRSLTSMQKKDAIEARQRKAYRETADAQTVEAKNIRDRHGKESDAIALEEVASLNLRLSEMPSLLDKIHESSKQAFEDGLLTFLTTGIIECKNLGEAVRNLAISVLQSIQKIYAEALNKNIMSMMGFGANPRPTIGNKVVQGPLNVNGKFAEGGDVQGPGTGTSDSILAKLSNGEFVIKASSVLKYGKNFLHRLNNGFVPTNLTPRFATGGLVGSSADGASGIASSIQGGDVSVPLKVVNITDPNEVGRYLKTKPGERVMVNFMKNNAGTMRQILNIRG